MLSAILSCDVIEHEDLKEWYLTRLNPGYIKVLTGW